jgi:glycosyltransferase involved in cell wall biosynthesis
VRILYHHRTQAEDGQAVHIRALIAAFRALGDEVREVSLVRRTDAASAAPASSPASSGGGGFSWVGALPRFARELLELGYGRVARGRLVRAGREFRPDVLYERYAFGNSAGVLAARSLGVPLVLEVNSPMVIELERTRGLSFPRLARRVENGIFRAADVVCVVTEVLKGILVDLGVAPERIVVTPNGVDPERYATADRTAARRSARTALGLKGPERGLVLGFVGFYRDWHRLDVVLEAMSAPELAATELVLVGEGPAHTALVEACGRLGLSDRVHFAGPRPHAAIPDLLPAFDVALVPAINPYASPLKLFEYLAAELAVIAPDQPNLREVLSDGENALLVPPGEVDALRAALVRLSEDHTLRARLGAAARATIANRDLTWTGNARRVHAALEVRA